MKKLALLLIVILFSVSGIAQNTMPYILKYSLRDDTTIYHNISNLRELYINASSYEFITNTFSNSKEGGDINLLDTISIFQDHFKHLDLKSEYWDDILCSTEQIYFYKENVATNLPNEILLVVASDTIHNGFFNYFVYNDKGIPAYINFNNEHYMYVENYYDHYVDAIVLNNDSSFVKLDSIDVGSNFGSVLNALIFNTRSGYTNSNLQNATALANHLIGGVMMVEGGIALLAGCSMLIPGVNVVAGATIAIAGAATFIAGGLLTVRATDQLVSDGSHSEGFGVASDIIGAIGTMGANGAIRFGAREAVSIALNQTWNEVQREVDRRAEFQEAYERTKKIVESNLYTLDATLIDVETGSVRLSGGITRRLNNNDYWGIFICKDANALKIEDVSNISSGAPIGEFESDFHGLEPTETYYYRAYYYASEFNRVGLNPNFVAGKKAFVMPGIKTYPKYDELGPYSYKVYGKVQWKNSCNSGTIGVCYSENKELPTIEDKTIELSDVPNGDFNITISPGKGGYFYRMYMLIEEKVIYSDVEFLSDERSILEKIYATTNGNNWLNNTNWCKDDQPINKWYGVNGYQSRHDRWFLYDYVNTIDLENNNLNGNVDIRGLKYLSDLRLGGNDISSVYLKNCYSLDLGYSFTGLNGISLKSLTLDNCMVVDGNHSLGTIEGSITKIDSILVQNKSDLGNISFLNVTASEIKFYNCKFSNHGASFSGGSQVLSVVFDNCYIPRGAPVYYDVIHLTINNSTIKSYTTFGNSSMSIKISNSTIGGIYFESFTGTSIQFEAYYYWIRDQLNNR